MRAVNSCHLSEIGLLVTSSQDLKDIRISQEHMFFTKPQWFPISLRRKSRVLTMPPKPHMTHPSLICSHSALTISLTVLWIQQAHSCLRDFELASGPEYCMICSLASLRSLRSPTSGDLMEPVTFPQTILCNWKWPSFFSWPKTKTVISKKWWWVWMGRTWSELFPLSLDLFWAHAKHFCLPVLTCLPCRGNELVSLRTRRNDRHYSWGSCLAALSLVVLNTDPL